VGHPRYDQWQLEKAVAFFEFATGVRSGLTITAVGPVLDRRQLATDLRKWDAWYSSNPTDLNMEEIAEKLSYWNR
jgi:hypothetical protein